MAVCPKCKKAFDENQGSGSLYSECSATTALHQPGQGCGSAVVGFLLLAVLGWLIAGVIPVRCEWTWVNNFETAHATVLGIPLGSTSGPRGIHRALIEETHQRKQMIVVIVLGLLGALAGRRIGQSASAPAS